MRALTFLPEEMLGFFILVSGVAGKLVCPEIEDFWFALVTAMALFLIMHVRSRLTLTAEPKETPR